MAKLPDQFSLSGPASLRSGRAISTVDTSAFARGLGNAGAGVQSYIDSVREQESTVDIARAEAYKTQQLLAAENEFQQDPEYSTFDKRAPETSGRILSEASSLIRNPKMRERWQASAASDAARWNDGVFDIGMKRRRETETVALDEALSANRKLYTDPNIPENIKAKARSDIQGAIDVSERVGLLGPEDAQRRRQVFLEGADFDRAKLEVDRNPNLVFRHTVSPDIPQEGAALLDAIAGPESAGRYDVIYGGGTFADFADHPRQAVPITSGPNAGKMSTAAGKYQFIGDTWDRAKAATGAPDFSPDSQDKAAWWLAQNDYKASTGRDLLSDLKEGGRTEEIRKALAPTWEGLGKISGGEFASSVASGPNSNPDWWSRLSPEQRQIVGDQAEARLGQNARMEAAKRKAEIATHRDSMELGVLTGEVISEQSILGDPFLDDGDKATLIRSLRTQKKEGFDTGQALAQFRDGKLQVDPYDSDGRKTVDNLYGEILKVAAPEQIAPVVAELARQSGIVPKQAISTIMQGLESGNVDDVMAAAQFAGKLNALGDGILPRRDNGKKVQDAAVAYDHYVNAIGLQPEEAAQRLIDMRDPAKRADREALLKSDAVKKMLKDVSPSTVADVFDPGWFGFDPKPGDNPMAESAMVADYRDILTESLVDTNGDADLANAMAKSRFARFYRPSELSLSGDGVITRLPPEATYPAGPDGTHGYIRAQAIEALAAEGVTAGEVFLQAYEGTEADAKSGKPPRYQLWYNDENGKMQTFNLPFYAVSGLQPQPAGGDGKDALNRSRDRLIRNRVRERERQATIDSFGTGPNPLAEMDAEQQRFDKLLSDGL